MARGKISKTLQGASQDVQGSAVKTYDSFGFSGSVKRPSLLSTNKPAIIMETIAGDGSVTNLMGPSAFNDTLGSSAKGASTIGGLKRQTVPDFSLETLMIGQPEQLGLTNVFVDKANMTISSSNPNLSSGLRSRYLGATALSDERLSATMTIFGGLPTLPIVYSGSRGESTTLRAGFAAGTNDHFPGEVQIVGVIDTKAAQCRGFKDGNTRTLTMLTATGSFFALDIENSPFVDAIEKTLTYAGLTDTSIVSSFPLPQTGSINNDALLPNERFATNGFTYGVSQYGLDSKGTDSVAFGGWMK